MCEACLEWMNRCLTLKLNQAVQSSLWVNLNLRRVPSWRGTAISNCELIEDSGYKLGTNFSLSRNVYKYV